MRQNNRIAEQMRPMEFVADVNLYAEGSCMVTCGNTKVLCTASVSPEVPAWLKGQNRGWITAEYALLPRVTQTRVSRETKGVGGRTHEIQRLIGRSLRA
ncbi:MAG: ribonuclease PH, partial [Alphaproteobacteria bacterium]|nr:ribonuclease PH [Alphaproteobacteria bacterium]